MKYISKYKYAFIYELILKYIFKFGGLILSKKYYAGKNGDNKDIFLNSDKDNKSINGFKGSLHQESNSAEEANAYNDGKFH